MLVGELGLDGHVRPLRGVLPIVLAARAAGHLHAVVPAANVAEAALAPGMTVRGVRTLGDLVTWLRGDADPLLAATDDPPADPAPVPDLADVLGQPEARLALEIAAAGGHHLAMIGPPGAGKTMLASRLPGVLPPLLREQALEVTAVHSVAGTLRDDTPLITRPPFVDPHHSASLPAVIGGGSGHIRPGGVSLAHRGVLFLDEAPEFRPAVLDALRQPMESGEVLVARASGAVRFPARFQLVLAANPCPCAVARDVDCVCPAGVRRRYLGRLSGPLLDRVDIRLDLPPLDPVTLAATDADGEPSAAVAERVRLARERSAHRWRGTPWRCSSEVPGSHGAQGVAARARGGRPAGAGGALGAAHRAGRRPRAAAGVHRRRISPAAPSRAGARSRPRWRCAAGSRRDRPRASRTGVGRAAALVRAARARRWSTSSGGRARSRRGRPW